MSTLIMQTVQPLKPTRLTNNNFAYYLSFRALKYHCNARIFIEFHFPALINAWQARKCVVLINLPCSGALYVSDMLKDTDKILFSNG